MANNTSFWAWIVLTALLGVVIGDLVFSSQTEVKVPYPVPELKVVEVPSEIKYEVDPNPSDRAVEVLLKEIDENENLWVCDDDEYDPSEISVIRVRSSEVLKRYADDQGEFAIELSARLKYDNGEDHCYDNVVAKVEYNNDKEEPYIKVH